MAMIDADLREWVLNLPYGVGVLSPVVEQGVVELRYEEMNLEFARLLCVDRSAAIGNAFTLVHAGSEFADLAEPLRHVVETGEPLTEEVRVASKPVGLTATPVGEVVVIEFHDTATELDARTALARSETQFRTTLDALGEAVFLYSAVRDDRGAVVELRIELVNDAALRMSRLGRDQLVGRGLLEVFPQAAPDTFPKYVQVLESGHPQQVESTWLSDGEARTFEASVARCGDGVVAAARDITERLRNMRRLELAERERRASEARALQATRLESLGVMAGGIAHDFNNLLVGVLGNAEFALLQLPEDSSARNRIERIALAAQRAADLTRQLLDYAGSRSGPLDLVDLATLAAETCDLVAARLPASTKLGCSVTPGVPAVRGDRGQLQRVVMNLVINASDALGGRAGHVDMSVGEEVVGEEVVGAARPSERAAVGDLAPGRYVVLSVTDDGPGIASETLQRVFEPFFTTKPSGRGLGLAVVHGVVRAHSGIVVPTSTVGHGTTMKVYLPAADAVVPVPTGAGMPLVPSTNSPLVLVVDDDDSVREVSVLILEHAGMRVLSVRDGRAALDEFARRPFEFGAVLLDLTMPGMSGDQVLAEVRRIDPTVPVVLISGYSDAEVQGRLSTLSSHGFVKKPFRPGDLVDAVQRALRPSLVAGPDEG